MISYEIEKDNSNKQYIKFLLFTLFILLFLLLFSLIEPLLMGYHLYILRPETFDLPTNSLLLCNNMAYLTASHEIFSFASWDIIISSFIIDEMEVYDKCPLTGFWIH